MGTNGGSERGNTSQSSQAPVYVIIHTVAKTSKSKSLTWTPSPPKPIRLIYRPGSRKQFDVWQKLWMRTGNGCFYQHPQRQFWYLRETATMAGTPIPIVSECTQESVGCTCRAERLLCRPVLPRLTSRRHAFVKRGLCGTFSE